MNTNNKDDNSCCCSFCGKPKDKAKKRIAGPNGVYICDECITLCQEIIADDLGAPREAQAFELPRPTQIKEILDQSN